MVKIKVTDDKDLAKEIREAIKKNEGHCCCAIQWDDDNLCMCKDFRDQLARGELGTCGCGLYEIIEN